MSEIAIRVDGLYKQYHIGGKQERYRTLRDTIADAALAPFRRFRAAMRHSGVVSARKDDTIWALKDVSFEIKRGEVVGIIGSNGSGKSTLLKILSRITSPTAGWADIHGRVGSLLEVGTGFHAELTGRDNIYLNGAILGMKRADIGRRFDEIVSFSEVERFIDTPVKYYSSGMYLRLAFAVAAHLDPEILLVDEVLAVGDAAFQAKCLGKMGEVARNGRTVLFVSHQMGMILRLCRDGILLHKGQVQAVSSAREAVEMHLSSCSDVSNTPMVPRASVLQTKEAQILRAWAESRRPLSPGVFLHDLPILVKVEYTVQRDFPDLLIGVSVLDRTKRRVFTTQRPCSVQSSPPANGATQRGRTYLASITVPPKTLAPGRYSLMVALHIPFVQTLDQVEDVSPITIIDGGTELAQYEGGDYGCVLVECDWEIAEVESASPH